MGSSQSSYGSTFALQQDIDLEHRGSVHGVFIDYQQFPASGIIGVTPTSI